MYLPQPTQRVKPARRPAVAEALARQHLFTVAAQTGWATDNPPTDLPLKVLWYQFRRHVQRNVVDVRRGQDGPQHVQQVGERRRISQFTADIKNGTLPAV